MLLSNDKHSSSPASHAKVIRVWLKTKAATQNANLIVIKTQPAPLSSGFHQVNSFKPNIHLENEQRAYEANSSLTMNLESLNRLPLACSMTVNQTRNWTFQQSIRGNSTIDFGTCALRPLTDASFWVIGLAIMINTAGSMWRLRLLRRFRQDYLADIANPAPPTSGKPSTTTWMPPCFTSRPFISLDILICLLFSGIIFYEGGAVLLTAWRSTIMLIQLSFPTWEPMPLAVCSFVTISITMLVAWALVLFVGYYLVKVQWCMVKELIYLYRENPWKEKKSNDVELGEFHDDDCETVYEGWQQAELRVL